MDDLRPRLQEINPQPTDHSTTPLDERAEAELAALLGENHAAAPVTLVSHRRRRWLLPVTAAAAAVTLAAGIGLAVQSSQRPPEIAAPPPSTSSPAEIPAPAAPAQGAVDEPYAHASLAELAELADLIVRGTVTDITEVTHEYPEVDDGDVTARVYHVHISETLSGESGQDTVRVYTTHAIGGHELQIEGQPTLRVGDEALWILTEMDPQFGEGYVPVSTASIIRIHSGTIAPDQGQAPAQREAQQLGLEATVKELSLG